MQPSRDTCNPICRSQFALRASYRARSRSIGVDDSRNKIANLAPQNRHLTQVVPSLDLDLCLMSFVDAPRTGRIERSTTVQIRHLLMTAFALLRKSTSIFKVMSCGALYSNDAGSASLTSLHSSSRALFKTNPAGACAVSPVRHAS